MTARPVAQSLFPELVPDRPTGPLPLSVQTGTNSDLIYNIRELYLTNSVLDVTYGRGGWWQRYVPDPFTFHDLTLDGVDFRHLPHPDRSFDAVCFDPPYVPQGGMATSSQEDFRDRFGLKQESTPWWELRDLMIDGFAECARVADRWLLVKCADFVTGADFKLGSQWMHTAAAKAGIKCEDIIIHASGTGPGGHNIWEAKRCRRAHSYLLVFEVPR